MLIEIAFFYIFIKRKIDHKSVLIIFPLCFRKSVRNSNIFGVTFGTSTSLMMLAQAAAFALGGKLVNDGDLVFDDMFK